MQRRLHFLSWSESSSGYAPINADLMVSVPICSTQSSTPSLPIVIHTLIGHGHHVIHVPSVRGFVSRL